ncbi:MAG: AIR synthase-related protein, partial [Anaerovoracaceae bacterium]
INCLRLISSGAMIIIAAPEKKDEMLQKLAEAGVPACQIGEILPASEGLTLRHADGSCETIDPPGPDELYKVVK